MAYEGEVMKGMYGFDERLVVVREKLCGVCCYACGVADLHCYPSAITEKVCIVCWNCDNIQVEIPTPEWIDSALAILRDRLAERVMSEMED